MNTIENIPETYIVDKERALEIAYASKEERCLAVAGQLVDDVLDSYYWDSRDFAQDTAMATELYGIYQVYPEAFQHVPNDLYPKPFTEMTLLGAITPIYMSEGLPVMPSSSGWQGCRKRSVEELKDAAELREKIAEVLIDTPPSEAFMKDFDIWLTDHNSPVEKVASLQDTVAYYTQQAKSANEKTTYERTRIENGEGSMTKLKAILTKLENIMLELDQPTPAKHGYTSKYLERVTTAMNNEETTIGDLMRLWIQGRTRLSVSFSSRAAKAEQTFDMIMSGQAAVYTRPATDETL
ncbi:hypothetical protein KA047_00275 [Candidatus Saccharibacteria bacterium]|nr:hypothetical protein [Candidatus Saccharibacteria bacterium]